MRVTLVASGNSLPSVVISAPEDGSAFVVGDTVTFAATASDPDEGDLSGSITWSSNLDGTISSGASMSTTMLSTGTHTITASVTDAGGAPASDRIELSVQPAL